MPPLINTILFASLPAGNIAFTQTRKCHVPSRAALSSRNSLNKLQRKKGEGHKTHMHCSTAQPGRHAARRRGRHTSAANTVGETVSEEEDRPRQSQGLCREDYRPSIEGRIYRPIRLPSNGSNSDSSRDYQAVHAHAHAHAHAHTHNTHNTSASKPTRQRDRQIGAANFTGSKGRAAADKVSTHVTVDMSRRNTNRINRGIPAIVATDNGELPTWFHGPLSRDAAETKLKAMQQQRGAVAWLVREKQTNNAYVLSMWRCDDKQAEHCRIERSVREDGTRGSHFVVHARGNTMVRLVMCQTVNDVINVLRQCPVTSRRINGKNTRLSLDLPCTCLRHQAPPVPPRTMPRTPTPPHTLVVRPGHPLATRPGVLRQTDARDLTQSKQAPKQFSQTALPSARKASVYNEEPAFGPTEYLVPVSPRPPSYQEIDDEPNGVYEDVFPNVLTGASSTNSSTTTTSTSSSHHHHHHSIAETPRQQADRERDIVNVSPAEAATLSHAERVFVMQQVKARRMSVDKAVHHVKRLGSSNLRPLGTCSTYNNISGLGLLQQPCGYLAGALQAESCMRKSHFDSAKQTPQRVRS